MSMEEHSHIYRARLDFLYRSIAIYATTLVIYLVVRSIVDDQPFPILWQDPVLLLLSAITMLSVLALLYNIFMRRQIKIAGDEINFSSSARQRTVNISEVAYVIIGPDDRRKVSRIHTVRIWLKEGGRPVRIRLANFERGRKLLSDLRQWAGPLAKASAARRFLRPSLRRTNRATQGGATDGAVNT
jgi:hypothetical protein